MHPLFEANLKKSLRQLDMGAVGFELEPGKWCLMPQFRGPRTRIACPQSDYFGFYALRSALRGALMAVNFQGAGQILSRARLYGPTVLMFYSSAYHTLQSYLSTNGRVPYDQVEYSASKEAPVTGPVLAVLTRGSTWCYESIQRSHMARWRQLKQVFAGRATNIPHYYHRLFRYFFCDCYKSKMPLDEWLHRRAKGEKVEIGTRYETHELLDEFLTRIANTRHHALYRSFGSDPHAYEALVNRDNPLATGLKNQVRAFEEFSTQFLVDQLRSLHELAGRVGVSAKVLSPLFLSTYFPWFDETDWSMIPDPALKEEAAWLQDWLLSNRRR